MKGKRDRVEPNIYRYASGRFEVRIAFSERRVVTRFAATTTIETLRAYVVTARGLIKTQARQAGDVAPAPTASGTLEADAVAYWRQVVGSASERSHLRAWFDVVVDGVRLGSLDRRRWTTKHVNEAIAQWQAPPAPQTDRRVRVDAYTRTGKPLPAYERAAPATSGRVVAALTIRHRCRVLDDLFRTLDGSKAPSPVDDAKIPKRGKRPPQTVPIDVVAAVLKKLRAVNLFSFVRFYVAATTGQRPCQIGRAQPDDLDLQARTWLVRNAKGAPAHLITLGAPQVAAWQAFIAAGAWSFETDGFDTSQYGKHVHAAGWPAGIRPYNARHTLAVEAIRRGVSLGDLQALLGHRDPTTTRIYAPFVIDRQREVSATMDGYLSAVSRPQLVGRKRGRS